MSDRNSFLRSIVANPDDDTPRLVFADWLDEHTEKVACERCGGTGCTDRYPGCDDPSHRCPDCDGSGTIPDACGDRAEFIRVQCEIARIPGDPDVPHPSDNYLDLERKRLLRRRERELWAELVGHAHDTGGRLWGLPVERVTVPTRTVAYDRETYVVSRGFVSAITLHSRTFLGGPCGRCRGQGRLYENRTGDRFVTERDMGDCPTCDGKGHTPGVAAELFRRHPVQGVTLPGKEPFESTTFGQWVWFRDMDNGERRTEPAYLPKAAFGELDGPSIPHDRELAHKAFATEAECRAALSAACVRLGRGRAKAADAAGSPG